ncbi:hypothetical protein ALC60_14106 [Trachymyrmex zeteki]|uniref:Transposable element P transposase-like GTP-binding insertion domain-containing protein n=1 Tax=Mycetomoellerius zeteki TaxID=64791 RepID=A0A151WGE1_9HYME|nr:hypothetical protein ALC60_14106 [Trachymyrmex zeteki]
MSVNVKPGFLTEVYDAIVKFPNSSSGTFVGTYDYGNGLALEDPDVLAMDLLVFLPLNSAANTETIKFIRIIDRLFDFLNFRNPF